jgi:hypothetical protein
MTQQLTLAGMNYSSNVQVLTVIDDLGPLGASGVSNPRYVCCENGDEYILKGIPMAPKEPFAAVNELVSALIAGTLGLPVLSYGVAEFGGHMCFASSYMASGAYYPVIDESLFKDCENSDRVYALLVFDVWLCNDDRHQLNLIVRNVRQKVPGKERKTLVLNDHSRCLIHPGWTAADLPTHTRMAISPYIRLDFLSEAVSTPNKLKAALDVAMSVTDAQIRSAVQCVPSSLLPVNQGAEIADFLIDRRGKLRSLFRAERHVFINLGIGEI